MYQNSSCITFPGVASHISNETPCTCCKSYGMRVMKNIDDATDIKQLLRKG